MEDLVLELKQGIIEVLNLEGVSPEDINADEPLFNSDLGLDSIDALELIVLMDKNMVLSSRIPAKARRYFKLLTQWQLLSKRTEQNNNR